MDASEGKASKKRQLEEELEAEDGVEEEMDGEQEFDEEDGEGSDDGEDYEDDDDDDDEEEDDDDPELSDLDEEEKKMEVQVDFAFFDPEEIDYHAIKNFLLPFLEGQAFNAGDLADLIIKQNEYVGTVVKVEGEDETYGFVSVVNLHKHKDLTAVRQIKEYLLSKAPNQSEKERLESLFNDESQPLGLLFNERLINLPPQLAPHLHKALFSEIQAAVEDGDSSFQFENYILISNQYSHSLGESTDKPKSKKGRTGEETFYTRPEEEFYQKEANFFFTFPVMHGEEASRWTFDGSLKDNRAVLLINQSKIPAILEKLFKVCA